MKGDWVDKVIVTLIVALFLVLLFTLVAAVRGWVCEGAAHWWACMLLR